MVKKKTAEEKILDKLNKIENEIKIQNAVAYFRDVGAILFTFGVALATFSFYSANSFRLDIAALFFAFAGLLYLVQSEGVSKPFEKGKPSLKKTQRFVKNYPLTPLGIALMAIAIVLILV
jgi:hypothetical protein